MVLFLQHTQSTGKKLLHQRNKLYEVIQVLVCADVTYKKFLYISRKCLTTATVKISGEIRAQST